MLVRPSLCMCCPAQVIHTKPPLFLFHLDIPGSKNDFWGDDGDFLLRDLKNEYRAFTKDFIRKCL